MPVPNILDRFDIIEGFKPVDMSTGANSGDYICLKDALRVAIVLIAAPGAAGEPPTIHIDQATTVAGGSVKNGPTKTTYWSKTAATDLTATGVFTKKTQAASYDIPVGTDGSLDKIAVVELDPSELDVTNGFDCMRVTIADVGATAQLGTLFYIVEKKNQLAPDRQLSHIID